MIKLLLLVIFGSILFATDALVLQQEMLKVNASSHTYYVSDKNSDLNASDILNDPKLTVLVKGGHVITQQGPVWTKTTLQNDTNKSRSFIVYNPLPGTNYIDVYLYKNDSLIKTYILGDLREQTKRPIVNRFSSFELLLAPREQITIISKVSNYNIVNITWIIEDTTLFIQEEAKFLTLFSLVAGVFLIAIAITFILYLLYKDRAYFIISLYLLFTFIYQYTIQGIWYALDIGINLEIITLIAWSSPTITSSFLLLFAYYFFDMNVKYKKLSYFLQFLIFINILLLLVILYASFINENFFLITSSLIAILVFLDTLYLLIIGFYMKEIGSRYYLLGQVILFFAIIINASSTAGIIEFENYYRYIITISSLLDVVLLFIALSLKTNQHLKELSMSKTMLIEQSRFSSMGQAIGHITHQWKQPLTLLGTSVTLLETLLKHDRAQVTTHLEKELPVLSESIKHMKNTLHELSNFYSSNVKKTSFPPSKTINNVIDLLHAKINLKNASVKLDIEESLKMHTYEYMFSNIIIVLLDNSLDAFEHNEKNEIRISLVDNHNEYLLTFKDNAGGIKMEPIEDIFEYFVTSKADKDGQGIGLALVKMLVHDRLDGSISVANKDDGVEFKIHFKK